MNITHMTVFQQFAKDSSWHAYSVFIFTIKMNSIFFY